MEEMAEDSEENYNKHFSQFIAADLEGDGLEDLYKEVCALLQSLPTLLHLLLHSLLPLPLCLCLCFLEPSCMCEA